MSKRGAAGGGGGGGRETIRTSIRIRPCSAEEHEAFPGPSPVEAAPGEVRVYAAFAKQQAAAAAAAAAACGSGSGSAGTPRSRDALPGVRQRAANPFRSNPPTGGGAPAAAPAPAASRPPSAAPGQHQHQVQGLPLALQQLSGDYQRYPFANVFGPEVGNEAVYCGSGCKGIVDTVLGGCNGTIFVYGQTGAGKTHTMDAFAQLALDQVYAAAAAEELDTEVCVTVSVVELYNEVLRCLLSGRENLQLRRGLGPGGVAGVVLEGAEERPCATREQAVALVGAAKASRAVAGTRANMRSSRSHLIIRIRLEVIRLDGSCGGLGPSASAARASSGAAANTASKRAGGAPASVAFSLLNLVDLAGSERVDKSGSADVPLRLREALNINRSLLCLGNVVNALAERAEGRRNIHIPYRDSKLTRLLEDSLGGNASTALLACVTPLPEWHLEQTRATLEFAARAARVVCTPQHNVVRLLAGSASADSAAQVTALQAEVAALKAMLVAQQRQQRQQQQVQQQVQQQEQQQQLEQQWCGTPWDDCLSEPAAEGATATAVAASQLGSPNKSARLPGWASRLRGSRSSSPARPGKAVAPAPAAAAAELPGAGHCSASSTASGSRSSDGDTPAAPFCVGGAQARSRAASSVGSPAGPGSRPSSSVQASLLWEFFEKVRPADRQAWAQEGCSSAAAGGRAHSSLRSTGLLMVPASNPAVGAAAAAEAAAEAEGRPRASSGDAGGSAGGGGWAGGAGTHVPPPVGAGLMMRWATFNSRCAVSSLGSEGSALPPCSSSDGGGFPPAGVADGASAAGCGYPAASGNAAQLMSRDVAAAAGQQIAAAEAAMALRDHIIKQLVGCLQQKKSELRGLREQQASLQQQLATAKQESSSSKQKLRQLAEGVMSLASARHEEFEKWKGHLEGVEAVLHDAQHEALTYRQEASALMQQLAQLQARYRSLQSDQLRRGSMLQSVDQAAQRPSPDGSGSDQAAQAPGQAITQQSAHWQLADAVAGLHGVEGCLRQLLAQSVAPLTHVGALPPPLSAAGGPPGSWHLSLGRSSPSIRHATAGLCSGVAAQQAPSSRADTSKADRQQEGPPQAATMAGQLERALQQLQATLPAVKQAAEAAEAAVAAQAAQAAAARAAAAEAVAAQVAAIAEAPCGAQASPLEPKGKLCAKEGGPRGAGILACGGGDGSGMSDDGGCAADRIPAVRPEPDGAEADNAVASGGPCRKCETFKSLLALMAKLKQEVLRLRATLSAREAELAVAAGASAAMRRDLEESRHQVGSLQERIDELAEELELRKESAAAAAAAGARAGSGGPRGEQAAAGSSAAGDVPLMAADAPLPELHAQILQSWHVLGMPRSYRAAFVLGHGRSGRAAPWADRAQCQAHVALLACLHQLQEDDPPAVATLQAVLADEAAVMATGLTRLDRGDWASLVQCWGVPDSESPAAQALMLMQRLWAPCASDAADAVAAASAAASQLCLAAAPPVPLAALTLRTNAGLLAATGSALADAAG